MNRNRYTYIYDLLPWSFGEVGLVLRMDGEQRRVCRILLPHEACSTAERIKADFPDASLRTGKSDKICLSIREFLSGKSVDSELGKPDFSGVTEFSRRVLQACGKIPRGRVETYGGLSARLGIPGGGRAVGNALAGNPFPLVIPCHRIIRSDGSIGGFGGGLLMKRKLLEMEGIRFDERGRVLLDQIL